YCGNCGAPLYTWAAAKGKDFYHCKRNLPRYRKPGATTCPNRHMSRHLLEPRLDEVLTLMFTDRDFLIEVVRSHIAHRQTQLPSTDELLRAHFQALQEKRGRVIEAFVDGNLTRFEKNEHLSAIDKELDSLSTVEPLQSAPIVDEQQVASIVGIFR